MPPTDREKQLENIIKQMLTPLKNLPLDLIIESICSFKILPYDGHARKELERIIDLSAEKINKTGIESRRPNEVGNYCEPFVIEAIRENGFAADKPRSSSGKIKAMGYPDIQAEILGKTFYLEVKSYNLENQFTSQRSFYLSPSKDFKVTCDAYHLIISFSMRQRSPNLYETKTCKVLDSKNLLCDVKYEFQSDNSRMYAPGGDLLVFERVF